MQNETICLGKISLGKERKFFEESIARFGVVQVTDYNTPKSIFAVHQEVFQAQKPEYRYPALAGETV